MNWLYFVIFAHFLLAIVFALDKVLVKKYLSPISYAVAIGGLEGFALLLIPFVDFVLPDKKIILVGFFAGVIFLIGLYFYFKTLVKYEASWAVPLLYGVFVPIFTLIFSRIFLGEKLTFLQSAAFFLLVLGGLAISFNKRYGFYPIANLMASGLFFGLYFVFIKIVFNHSNFFSGYILASFGGFIAAFIIFIFLHKRDYFKFSLDISIVKKSVFNSFGATLAGKQVLSFLGNIILVYSVSLGSPVIINSLGGIRYVFLLFLALGLSKKWPKLMDEPMNKFFIFKKILAILLIIFGILILVLKPADTPGAKVWGVTFSSIYAKELGLDEKELLGQILDDLKAREFRLIAYWPEIEKTEGVYDFSDLDYQINEISKRNGKAILAVGMKLPRWPECFEPDWTSKLENGEKNRRLLYYIEATVNHYKNNSAVWAWQVENEYFFNFGGCLQANTKLLNLEINLIKGIDNRPVILTDSGEFGRWYNSYSRADIFGTTMYRKVWSQYVPGGYFEYPFDPNFFKMKAALMYYIFGKKPIIDIELQAEPWNHQRPPDTSLEEQFKDFDLEQFRKNISYAREVGFEKNYLWGVEWWYWMKEKQNHSEFLEEARKLF